MNNAGLITALTLDPLYRVTLLVEDQHHLTGLVSDVSCTDPVNAVIETGTWPILAADLARQIAKVGDPAGEAELYHNPAGSCAAWYAVAGVQVDRLNHVLVIVAGGVLALDDRHSYQPKDPDQGACERCGFGRRHPWHEGE